MPQRLNEPLLPHINKYYLRGVTWPRIISEILEKQSFSYFQANKRALAISQKTAMPQR
jgi:hypothetical protein